MQKNLRKKRNHIKRIVIFYSSFLIVLVAIFAALNFQNFTFNKPLVSPLALKKITSKITDKPALEQLLHQKKIKYKKILVASDSSYLVQLEDGSNVIFSQNKDSAEQLSSLQLIQSRFTIEGKRFSRLDLRFDNPIIVLK